jgi:hypothetical protein
MDKGVPFGPGSQASPGAAKASPPSVSIPDAESDEGFYDDAGRWWPSNAEWCDRCQGMGTEDCDCGGDFCVCGAYDNLTCRRCGGEGYWIPTPADLAARKEHAKWWNELHQWLRDSDGNPKGGDSEAAPSPSDDSAGRKASPKG